MDFLDHFRYAGFQKMYLQSMEVRMKKHWLPGLSAVMLLAAGAAQATELEIPVYQYEDVPFVSGGIGNEEQKVLKAVEDKFTLKLVSAMKSGAYLSDIDVTVRDMDGNIVVQGKSDGPWFYTRLEPGTYKVEATHDGVSHSRKVKVGTKLRTIHFRW